MWEDGALLAYIYIQSQACPNGYADVKPLDTV